jgi:glycosyltransferase involved in cell wall biosynthesis
MIAGHQGQPWSHVIYGGVDPIKFSPSPEHRESNVIVYVGRLLAHKGINYLIEALPENLCLRIIGNAYNSEYFDLLKNLAKGKNVKFETDCDDPTIVRAYQDALCVVLPSVYRDYYGKETKVPELLGQTLLEGMASGVPVICTDVASMPEIVSDSVTGFVVPPNDPEALRNKLSWLGDHPKETHQMGQAARQSILDRFNWASVARKCIEIYKR